MTDHSAVWAAARPYMHARKNDVHIPMAYAYAQRLLDQHPQVDSEVVSLSILLHDIGWAVVDQEAIYREGFGPNMMQSDVRIAHEREGARLAEEILSGLGYEPHLRARVVEIIDGHDTRADALSAEDELVKDADALWRFLGCRDRRRVRLVRADARRILRPDRAADRGPPVHRDRAGDRPRRAGRHPPDAADRRAGGRPGRHMSSASLGL